MKITTTAVATELYERAMDSGLAEDDVRTALGIAYKLANRTSTQPIPLTIDEIIDGINRAVTDQGKRLVATAVR